MRRLPSRVSVELVVLLAVSAALMWEPIAEPVRTKVALGMVQEHSDARVGASPGTTDPDPSSFLAPSRTWSQIVRRVRDHFGTPTGFFLVDPGMSLDELYATVADGNGSCSTYAEALVAMCIEAGRTCREWANVAPPGVEARGHSVVDVWLPRERRWAMLDVSLGFWARTPDGRPLSAPELKRLLEEGSDEVVIEPLRRESPDRRRIEWIYGHRASRLVELVDNDPTAMRAHWAIRLERLGKPFGQIVEWALGMGPHYLVAGTGARELRASLHVRRLRLAAALTLLAVTAVVAWRSLRTRRRGAIDRTRARDGEPDDRCAEDSPAIARIRS